MIFLLCLASVAGADTFGSMIVSGIVPEFIHMAISSSKITLNLQSAVQVPILASSVRVWSTCHWVIAVESKNKVSWRTRRIHRSELATSSPSACSPRRLNRSAAYGRAACKNLRSRLVSIYLSACGCSRVIAISSRGFTKIRSQLTFNSSGSPCETPRSPKP